MTVSDTPPGRPKQQTPVARPNAYLVAAGSAYVGYRIGRGRAQPKNRPSAVIWVLLVGLLSFVVIGYLVVQIFRMLLALCATIVYLTCRSRRTWMWTRITWGLCALPVFRLRFFGRGLTAHERNRLIVAWVNSVPLTGVYRPRRAETR